MVKRKREHMRDCYTCPVYCLWRAGDTGTENPNTAQWLDQAELRSAGGEGSWNPQGRVLEKIHLESTGQKAGHWEGAPWFAMIPLKSVAEYWAVSSTCMWRKISERGREPLKGAGGTITGYPTGHRKVPTNKPEWRNLLRHKHQVQC